MATTAGDVVLGLAGAGVLYLFIKHKSEVPEPAPVHGPPGAPGLPGPVGPPGHPPIARRPRPLASPADPYAPVPSAPAQYGAPLPIYAAQQPSYGAPPPGSLRPYPAPALRPAPPPMSPAHYPPPYPSPMAAPYPHAAPVPYPRAQPVAYPPLHPASPGGWPPAVRSAAAAPRQCKNWRPATDADVHQDGAATMYHSMLSGSDKDAPRIAVLNGRTWKFQTVTPASDPSFGFAPGVVKSVRGWVCEDRAPSSDPGY